MMNEFLLMKGMVDAGAKAGYRALGVGISRSRLKAGGILGVLLGE